MRDTTAGIADKAFFLAVLAFFVLAATVSRSSALKIVHHEDNLLFGFDFHCKPLFRERESPLLGVVYNARGKKTLKSIIAHRF